MTIRMSDDVKIVPFQESWISKRRKSEPMIPGSPIGLRDTFLFIFLRHKMNLFEAAVRSVIVVVKIMQCSVEASAFLYETMLLLSSTFAVT